jgi:membrane protease subunit (stomatin/prohibitin family)
MSEGMDLLNKMKSMPGMGDMSKIFSQMGIPGLDKNTKVNMGAMEAQMNKTMKMAKMKERMRSKVEQKAQNSVPQVTPSTSSTKPLSEAELIKIFSSGEKAERTPRGAKPPATTPVKTGDQQTSSKKKKGKK